MKYVSGIDHAQSKIDEALTEDNFRKWQWWKAAQARCIEAETKRQERNRARRDARADAYRLSAAENPHTAD